MYGNLKQFRESLGISQKDFAAMLGIGQTTYNGYETGARDPKSEFWVEVATKFGVTIDYLMGYSDNPKTTSDNVGYILSHAEQQHIKKYRTLDRYGKDAVDSVLNVESRRCESAADIPNKANNVRYVLPQYLHSMSAGTGEYADDTEYEDITLVKRPPSGTSYIAKVRGDSMEPTFSDGDLLFVHASVNCRRGQIGVWLMDGQQWVKELGDGVLISHNPEYEPRRMIDARCQGVVLGVCDSSYFE